jgi:predicted naringenin-chalcone synthase
MIFAAFLLCISLCSCAAQNKANISRNLIGPTVIGDGNSVLVSHVRNQTDGQQLAEKHCKRFGKSARFNRMEGLRAYFDCRSGSQMAR